LLLIKQFQPQLQASDFYSDQDPLDIVPASLHSTSASNQSGDKQGENNIENLNKVNENIEKEFSFSFSPPSPIAHKKEISVNIPIVTTEALLDPPSPPLPPDENNFYSEGPTTPWLSSAEKSAEVSPNNVTTHPSLQAEKNLPTVNNMIDFVVSHQDNDTKKLEKEEEEENFLENSQTIQFTHPFKIPSSFSSSSPSQNNNKNNNSNNNDAPILLHSPIEKSLSQNSPLQQTHVTVTNDDVIASSLPEENQVSPLVSSQPFLLLDSCDLRENQSPSLEEENSLENSPVALICTPPEEPGMAQSQDSAAKNSTPPPSPLLVVSSPLHVDECTPSKNSNSSSSGAINSSNSSQALVVSPLKSILLSSNEDSNNNNNKNNRSKRVTMTSPIVISSKKKSKNSDNELVFGKEEEDTNKDKVITEEIETHPSYHFLQAAMIRIFQRNVKPQKLSPETTPESDGSFQYQSSSNSSEFSWENFSDQLDSREKKKRKKGMWEMLEHLSK
jgi:hypothetical protein